MITKEDAKTMLGMMKTIERFDRDTIETCLTKMSFFIFHKHRNEFEQWHREMFPEEKFNPYDN